MIDFILFPEGMITNLKLHEIKEILEDNLQPNEAIVESSDKPNDTPVHPIPDEVMKELNGLEEEMKSDSSSKQEKEHSERFLKFLSGKDVNIDLKTASENELNHLLRWY